MKKICSLWHNEQEITKIKMKSGKVMLTFRRANKYNMSVSSEEGKTLSTQRK